MKCFIFFCINFLVIPSLFSQTLDATISINGSNKLVITINSPASFEFNQTVTGGAGFSLIIDEVYSVDPPALTTNPISGSISYTCSNGNAGNVIQMGPFGFDFGAYTIRDDELTFPTPANSFNMGDVFTIQAGTITSNAAFISPPTINPGPYTAFIVSDDFNSVAASQVILPVELTKFSGIHERDNVTLFWETASETNNKGFEIEHSVDANKWQRIGFKIGTGNSNIFSQYEFTHNSYEIGSNYYRLKQLDFDGKFEYSEIINVSILDNQEINISPNPATEIIRLNNVAEGEIRIYDISGKFLKELDIIDQEINISDLPNGVLFFQIVTKNQNSIKRIIKN